MPLVALLAAGCALSGSDSRPSSRADSDSPEAPAASAPSGDIHVERVDRIAAAHVVGNKVLGLPGARGPRRLAGALNSPFTANLAPAAVPLARDGRAFAYHSFRAGRSVIRRYDAKRRRDSVIAEGAFSLASRRDDGTRAYVKGLKPKVADPASYRGHVVVRDRHRRGVRWTSRPGRYVVAAWAGERLIAYRLTDLSADVLAFDGPGRVRPLARNSFLVALSPDGRLAFTSEPDSAGATVRVIDVATGSATGRLSLRGSGATDPVEPTTFVAGGSWVGDHVVGATNLGLLVFKVESRRITLEQTINVDLTLFPTGLQEPRFDPSGRRILARAELLAKPRQALAEAALLDCDRMTLRCRQGPPAAGLQAPRVLYNPSRP
jgi:hypothetical protein